MGQPNRRKSSRNIFDGIYLLKAVLQANYILGSLLINIGVDDIRKNVLTKSYTAFKKYTYTEIYKCGMIRFVYNMHAQIVFAEVNYATMMPKSSKKTKYKSLQKASKCLISKYTYYKIYSMINVNNKTCLY